MTNDEKAGGNIPTSTTKAEQTHKIVLVDGLSNSVADLLHQEGWQVEVLTGSSQDELVNSLKDAEGLIIRSATQVDATLLSSAPNLKVVARAGTGVDNIDLMTASELGILVLNSPGANSISVAEHTCALILTLGRSIARADADMKKGSWTKQELLGTELWRKTLGLVGLGRIGQEVASRTQAFGMRILAHDPYISEEIARNLNVELVSLDELCAQSDFLSLHVPSSVDTFNMFDADRLSKCKPGLRLINTARGDLIDEAALADAIESGHIGGAGLDVFSQEPPTETRLTALPDVVATPHIAGSTEEAQELVGVEAAAGVRDYIRLGIIRNAVNFPAIAPEETQRLQPFVNLAQKIGAFVAQLATGRIKTVSIRYYGELATKKNELLVGAVLMGLFKTMLSTTVSLINARALARDRDVEVIESHSTRPRDFTSLLAVRLETSLGQLWVEGALFEYGGPRLVLLDGVDIEASIEGTSIVIRNLDEPGVVGTIGAILGGHGINIAQFALGRDSTGAVAVVNIDESMNTEDLKPDGAVIKELLANPAIKSADLVRI
jgi:D-3-phosphoglycerate dehydrogenase